MTNTQQVRATALAEARAQAGPNATAAEVVDIANVFVAFLKASTP